MNYVFLLKVVLKRELNQLGITQMQSHANNNRRNNNNLPAGNETLDGKQLSVLKLFKS